MQVIDGKNEKVFTGNGLSFTGVVEGLCVKLFFLVSSEGEPTQEDLDARARLFNAAPELLEVVEALAAYRKDRGYLGKPFDDLIEQAEAALAKVREGEE